MLIIFRRFGWLTNTIYHYYYYRLILSIDLHFWLTKCVAVIVSMHALKSCSLKWFVLGPFYWLLNICWGNCRGSRMSSDRRIGGEGREGDRNDAMLLLKTDQSAQPLKGVQRVYRGNNANGTIEIIIWKHMITIMSTKIEQSTLKMTNQKRRQLSAKRIG